MDFNGKIVNHTKLGKGIVVEKKDSYIFIKFDNCFEVKQMSYPMIFENLATFEDSLCQKQAKDDLKTLQAEKEILPELVLPKPTIKYDTKLIKAGSVFNFNTHAALVNHFFSTKYKNLMKSVYILSENYFMWFVRFDGVVRDGWKNTIKNDVIIEEYVMKPPYPSNIYEGIKIKYRAVFNIIEGNKHMGRKYIFEGVYEYCSKESTLTRRVCKKVADETNLKDY